MNKNLATIIISAFSSLVSIAFMVSLQLWNKKEHNFKQNLHQAGFATPTTPFVSVLVPARNEEAEIKGCLISILEQAYPNFEVLAMDDHSTDRTPHIMAALATEYPNRLRVIEVKPPEDNWLGKQNALWQGYLQINPRTEWLLFVDADAELKPGILQTSLQYAIQHEIDLFSLVPEIQPKDFWFSLLHPAILVYYALADLRVKSDPMAAVQAHGAFSLVRREAYAAVGGHKSIKNFVRNDVRLARLLWTSGFKIFFEEGDGFVDMKPYDGLKDYWSSMSRNLFLRTNKSWLKTSLILGFQWLHGFLPFLLLPGHLNLKNKTTLFANLTAMTLVLVLQWRINATLHISPFYAFLYPCGVPISTAIFLDLAYRTSFGRAVKWKGRDVNILQN